MRIRVENIIINAKVIGILVLIWVLLKDHSCLFIASEDAVKFVCRDGTSTFAGIALTVNTSIVIPQITSRLINLLNKYIYDKCQKYAETLTADDKKEHAVTEAYEQSQRLKNRLEDFMATPGKVYPLIGVVVSSFIGYLLYAGFPIWMRNWIIVLPFPAIAYYGTALLAYCSIIVQINGDFLDRFLANKKRKESKNKISLDAVLAAAMSGKMAAGDPKSGVLAPASSTTTPYPSAPVQQENPAPDNHSADR